MASNGNVKRKLTITKGLTIVGMIMLFIILAFCVWQMATGGKNEEHLSKVALACALYIFVQVIAFHGKEFIEKLTGLILSFKGIASSVLKSEDKEE